MKPLVSPDAADIPGVWRIYYCDVIDHCRETGSANSAEFIHSVACLGESLAQEGDDNGSIALQEQWAVYHEARQEWSQAADRREREVSYLFRLFRIGGAVSDINCNYLISRLQLLLTDLNYGQRSQRYSYVKEIIELLEHPDVQGGIDAGTDVPAWVDP